MNILSKLNPRNSLFGRILVWFWIAVTLMVVLAFFIARFISQTWDINAPDAAQQEIGQAIQKKVNNLLSENNPIERALKKASGRGRFNLLAVNVDTDEITLNFPPPMLDQKERFHSLKYSQQALLIRNRNMEFIGPLLVSAKDQDYQLFIGRLLRRDQRPYFAFAVALGVFLITGTLACIAIAWTIAKPIKELSALSNSFAKGAVGEATPATSKVFKHRKDELGQLHNDIYSMASNLAKSLSQQKALMANISHELRTPLTRLQLALAMLNPTGDDQILYAKRIEKDIGTMDQLIGQTLQLAKMNDENHAQWFQVEKIFLRALLSPVLDDLRFEAEASDVVFDVVDSTSSNLEVALIKNSFISAIENVTRNAIKYSEKMVRLSINIIEPRASNNQQMLSICIEDDGEGLSAQQRLHIFEPFYRAPSGMHYQGTGLGLAIAKASVELHNGEINADASDMGGLRLTLLFPIRP
jgi:two-component system sensor histidine kinase CpxA